MRDGAGSGRSAAKGFVVGLIVVVAVSLLRVLGSNALGDRSPLLLYMLAVVAAGWVGGFRPAAATTLLAAAAGTAIYSVPLGTFRSAPQAEILRLILFFGTGLGTAVMSGEFHRRSRGIIDRAESGRRQSEERYRQLFESIGDGFCVVEVLEGGAGEGPDARVVEANPAFCAATGLPDPAGQSLRRSLPGADMGWLEAVARVAATGKAERFEARLPAGGRWFEGHAFRVGPAEARQVAVSLRDVTDRRQAKESADAAARRFQRLIELTSQVTWVTDPDGRISEDSPSWRAFTGRTYEQWAGGNWLDAVHPDDRQRVSEAWARALETRSPCEVEHRGLHHSGEYRELSSHAAPILNDDGTVREWIGMSVDVSAPKRAAATLQEGEQRLRLGLAAGRAGTWDWDIRNNRVVWTERLYEFHGLRPGEFDGTVEAFQKLIHPDDAARVGEALRAALADGSVYELDFRTVRPDGEVRWLSTTGQVYFEDGRPVRMLGATIDVTDRRRAEDALRDSEARHRMLFEGNPNPMWLYDHETLRFLEVNDAAVAHYGYSREEFLSMTIADIRPPEDLPLLHAAVRRIGPRVGPLGVFRHRKKDGTIILVEISAHSSLKDGRQTDLVLALDVTERRRAEQALRQSERRFRELADTMPQLVWVADASGAVEYYNARAADYAGLAVGPDGKWKWQPVLCPEDVRHTQEAWQRSIETQVEYACEHRLQMADGSKRWHLSRARLVAGDGEAPKWFGTATDIHDLKTAQMAAADSQGRLGLLLRVSDAARAESDPARIAAAALETLRDHLGADRATWAEVEDDEDHFVFVGCSTAEGVAPVSGRYAVSAFGAEGLRLLRAGRPFVVRDSGEAPDAAGRVAYDALGVRALIAIPVHRDGRLVARIGVHSLAPRAWTDGEVELVRLVTERIWEAIERARAARARASSEERFRLAADAVNGLIYDYDIASGRVERTRGLFEVFGYRPEEVPANRDWWREQIHPDDRALRDRALEHFDGRPVMSEYRVRHRDGRWLHVEDRAVVVCDAAGRAVRLVGCATDVTERKTGEVALRRAEERTRLALAAGRMFAWEWMLADDSLRLSEAGPEMLGFRAGTSVTRGAPAMQRVHPEDVARLSAALEAAVRERRGYHEQVRMVREEDGAAIWLEIRSQPVLGPDGQVAGFVGVSVDVTERRQAEDRVQAERERVQFVADAVPALISYIDASARYRLNNLAYELWFGKPRQEVVGRHMKDVLGEAAWAKLRPYVEAALAGEVVNYEAEVPYREGGTRWINATYTPDVDASGMVRGLVAHVTDITARKHVEEALREADRRKDEFLATLAHELRNPLAAVSGAVQIVRMQGHVESVRQASADVLQRQVRHLARLIDDLMDVSRVSRGKITLQVHPIDLAPVLRQALDPARAACAEKGLSLHLATPEEPVRVMGDAARLLQVVGNLLNNAVKFTDRGGHVHVSLAREAGRAVIRVRDDGIGIPPDHLERVFEMFAQLDTSPGRANSGLGIGLSLVRSLVELHGGSVEARSEGPGRGSEFVVSLPALPEHGAEAGREDPAAAERFTPNGNGDGTAPPPRGRRVLVVDDNRDSADLLAQLLEMSGHEVQRAYDGLAAVEAAGRFDPEAIVLDIGLPGIDGYEAARRIRQQSTARRPFLIALTGWGQEGDRRRSAEAGFDTHLVKPPDHDKLLRLLEQLSPPAAEQTA